MTHIENQILPHMDIKSPSSSWIRHMLSTLCEIMIEELFFLSQGTTEGDNHVK
jgi:hypothetical protein